MPLVSNRTTILTPLAWIQSSNSYVSDYIALFRNLEALLGIWKSFWKYTTGMLTFDYMMQKPLEKTLLLGKIEGKRRRVWQRMRWLDHSSDSMDMNLRKLREIVKDRKVWYAAIHGVTKNQTQLSNWSIARMPKIAAQVSVLQRPRNPVWGPWTLVAWVSGCQSWLCSLGWAAEPVTWFPPFELGVRIVPTL